MLTGKHLINGEWTGEASAPDSSDGEIAFCIGSETDVANACEAAEQAFANYSASSAHLRSRLLDQIAEELEARADAITETGHRETALPKARLVNERGRTINQLKMFARYIESGEHLDYRHDAAQPEREPAARPDLRLVMQAVGPVAVFGASNFPLAFSVAGGDTASALAAGCPVVVKGHPAHPGTSELAAQAIGAAVKRLDLDPGVFSFIQSGSHEAGTALVRHPLIKAVGFTGSLAGGRALFDHCAQRPEPIPFFGELGSINPMFILPAAAASSAHEIGANWAASLTMGAGQFCTNPGIAIAIEGEDSTAFIEAAFEALAETDAQTMLTTGIANAYNTNTTRLKGAANVKTKMEGGSTGRAAKPALFVATAKAWLADQNLKEEVFGPSGMVVLAADVDEVLDIANELPGQLTCTLHLDEADRETAERLLPILARKAGRILANAYPTGVEVCDAMVHGGPYPASTNFGATSVGTLAIRRFLRPVCYQDIPESLLPESLSLNQE